jgi:hypothetical protein
MRLKKRWFIFGHNHKTEKNTAALKYSGTSVVLPDRGQFETAEYTPKTTVMKKRVFGAIVVGLTLFAAISLVVLLLWNALLPTIFGLVQINFWQAAGLFLLSRIFFCGLPGRGHGGGFRRGHPHHFHRRNNLRQKWMKMTPEEREAFISKRRQHLQDHFGRGGFPRRDFNFGGMDGANRPDDK